MSMSMSGGFTAHAGANQGSRGKKLENLAAETKICGGKRKKTSTLNAVQNKAKSNLT